MDFITETYKQIKARLYDKALHRGGALFPTEEHVLKVTSRFLYKERVSISVEDLEKHIKDKV